MTKTSKNTETSVLFNIQNIMDMQSERTRREAAERERQKEADEARRLEATLRAHAEKEDERLLAEHLRAEAALLERERRIVEREAEIKSRVEQETAQQIEQLRQAHAEGPVVLPRSRFSSIFAVAAMAIAVISLSTLAVVLSQDNQTVAANPSTGAAEVAMADRAVPPAKEMAPENTKPGGDDSVVKQPTESKPRINKPVRIKRRYKYVKSCRTKTVVVKRIRKLNCSALSFDGCFKTITKKVKSCRMVRVRVR